MPYYLASRLKTEFAQIQPSLICEDKRGLCWLKGKGLAMLIQNHEQKQCKSECCEMV